jgi:predicted nucleotidyltransferase
MATKDDKIIENRVIHFIDEMKKTYTVKAVYIYGSHSKGNANEWSDIDVAVILPDFAENMFDMRLKLMKIAARIDDRIEPHPFKVEDFDASNPLVSEIKKYGILLS